ncbi:hypothetical protein Aspvir_007885 [Aspergillus viridinutans]|uniref:Histidine-specific methyltransferase SAM-dependent domain-containing protein n=1 Tax=Aspergillus viridinutans TaxID=75553 RepID=A0A9P3C1V9_ASPVI|nr:uncharacterized protein Aspvir_007885 [Aspergillus viridinutans]GIK03811.1 hypothetical protein Aspvir_007885 [Aspergillus viridinutans]
MSSLRNPRNKASVLRHEDEEAALPDLLLWDVKGLRYFEEVTYTPSYYLTNEELDCWRDTSIRSQSISRLEYAGRRYCSNILDDASDTICRNLRKIRILLKALDELDRECITSPWTCPILNSNGRSVWCLRDDSDMCGVSVFWEPTMMGAND